MLSGRASAMSGGKDVGARLVIGGASEGSRDDDGTKRVGGATEPTLDGGVEGATERHRAKAAVTSSRSCFTLSSTNERARSAAIARVFAFADASV